MSGSAAVTTHVSNTSADSDHRKYFVGVEISPAIIRAGVFSESMRLIGKTKFSTKPERGPQAVIERVARCVAYAADECDLTLGQVQAVGVGVPGFIDSHSGMVRASSELSWEQVPLEAELAKLMALPVRIENVHQLGALGIYTQELSPKPRSFVAVFLGPQITGGWVTEGVLQDLKTLLPSDHGFDAPQGNVFGVMPHPLFQNFRSRDFRKALRRGNPAIRKYLLEIAERAGHIIARLARLLSPEVIALGGGVLDEMKEELLEVIRQTLAQEPAEPLNRTSLLTSALGDLAGITGAAAWVAGSVGTQQVADPRSQASLPV